jgi:ABC-type Fe3+/spermidine/putrescine transport system ATPase subunit
MPQIELKGVAARYGSTAVIHMLDLSIEKGECLALLGPSGCGKTTTLNLVAGFAVPSAGDVRINGKSVIGVPPHRRDTAMVFQSYALFPHLTVSENIAFGLQMRKVPAASIADRVKRALDLVQLSRLGDRYPKQLSGGQQQRVAIARALAVEPSVLLLDEPLSNLDAQLREEMRVELARIQRRVSVTTVLVTHDQADAIAVADRIAVMKDGRLQQVGAAREIYDHPATQFVAGFVGRANLLPVSAIRSGAGGSEVSLGDGLDVRCGEPGAFQAGASLTLFIRPEHLRLGTPPGPDANKLPARIEQLTYLGGTIDVILSLGSHRLRTTVGSSNGTYAVGDAVQVFCSPRDCLLFSADDAAVGAH